MEISIAQYMHCSKSNGVGKRSVIWLQGCDNRCIKCCNPQFQEFKHIPVNIEEISQTIIKDFATYNLRGITLSGGEPLHDQHTASLKQLIDIIRKNVNLDILAFSGYPEKYIIDNLSWVNDYIDLIIAGPFEYNLKHNAGIIASTNQSIMRLSNKFDDVTDEQLWNNKRIIETHVKADGEMIITGLIDPSDCNYPS